MLIEGENLLMDLQGVQRLGFFTTRYVAAEDMDDASDRAIALVEQELLEQGCLLNEQGDSPSYTVSEVRQINSFKGISVPGKGFTLYPMNS